MGLYNMMQKKPLYTKEQFWRTLGKTVGVVYTTTGIVGGSPTAAGIGVSALALSFYRKRRR